MPQTTNQRRYDHFIQSGLNAYNKAVESKSLKKTVLLAQQSMDYFEKAIQMAELVAMEERIPYVNEYIVLNHALIANILFQEKKYDESLRAYEKAMEINEKTLKNQETLIRDCFISSEMTKLYLLQKKKILVDKTAWRIFKNAKNLEDKQKAVKYLTIAQEFFKNSENLSGEEKTWKALLKILKKNWANDTKIKHEDAKTKKIDISTIYDKIRAEKYNAYGDFLLNRSKKPNLSNIRKYWKKSAVLYHKLHLEKKAKAVEKKIMSV
ncbi:MAG: hypothetical protein K9W44_07115 [Candidatus Lokiarchaeota archaeon]|nr:hypothetical protein [Candidatus Harpocratesius repetitus]